MIKAMLNVENNQDIIVAVMGILGACRREELCQMNLNNIKDLGNTLVVNIADSKTRVSRTFPAITEAYIDLYHKYLALRPGYVNHQRLFIKYTSNKCTIQPVGINIFGKMTTEDIARFLKLPNSELYTGHCFRRTSASLFADSGANFCTIKRHGGWKSSSVAEGYLEDSLENKKRIAWFYGESELALFRDLMPIPPSDAIPPPSPSFSIGVENL
ncbi:hypothetical protein NQ317_002266 [Molorchus minor]|uniref:Tyr recombinase domain-containing protein n=1 Tax=Molorchus minor TaxID=1323400 RepID=A0ABQ9JY18_9CUCU|nr:hypothetical protein NQ317_002266 [Molorchus minor]